MATITIPRKLMKNDDLVIIPRQEYEAFARWEKAVKIRLEDKWFWTPEWQKREAEADIAIKAGKVYGPFADHKSLITALKKKR